MIKCFLLLNQKLDVAGNIEDTKLYFTNLEKDIVNKDNNSKNNFLMKRKFRKEDTLMNFFEKLLKNSEMFSKENLEDKNSLQFSLIFPYEVSEKKRYEQDFLVHIYNRDKKGFIVLKAKNLKDLFTITVNTLKNEIVIWAD